MTVQRASMETDQVSAGPSHWGEVPSNWTTQSLADVTELVTDGSHNPPQRVERGVQLLSSQNVEDGRINFEKSPSYISEEDFERMDRNINVSDGDLLMTVVGTLGRSVVVQGDHDFALQRSVALLRRNKGINSYFLKYITDSWDFHRQVEARSRATAQSGLYLEELRKIRVPVPPLSEQRKIASVLYTVDGLIKKTDKTIIELERAKRGTRRELLQTGTRERRLVETGSRFGELPQTWSVRLLDDMVEVVGGTTPSTDDDQYWGGTVPWATPSDITELDGQEISSTPRQITHRAVEECALTVLPAGSILLTSRASIGKCAINTVPMATNQGFQSLIPSKNVDRWYLYYLMGELAPYLQSLGAGSTFQEISNSMMKRVEIPVPPREEQVEIANILRSFDRATVTNRRFRERAARLKRGLTQDLLSGEVRTRNVDIEIPEEVAAYG